MKKYKKFFKEAKQGRDINPIKDNNNINIMQLMAMDIISKYRSNRATSFFSDFKYYNHIVDRDEWKREQLDYISILGESASVTDLWNHMIKELFEKGLVDKRGSLNLKGKQFLNKLKSVYFPNEIVQDFTI